MQPRFQRAAHSDFTKNSVRMLQRSNDYQLFQAVADQGSRFRTMAIVSMVVYFVALYADFMTALVRHSSYLGAAMAACPAITHGAFLFAAFFTSAWMHTGAWSATHDSSVAVVNVFFAHVLSSVALAVVPTNEMHLPPFVTRATLAHPWPALVPFAATFPVGLVLFYARFAGFWRRKHIASSPFLRTAPMLMFVVVCVWWYLGAIVSQQHRPLDVAAHSVNADIAAYVNTTLAALKARPAAAVLDVGKQLLWTLSANARPLYGAMMAHTGSLAISTVLLGTVIPSVGEALGSLLWSMLPSGRTAWLFVVVAVVAEGAYLLVVQDGVGGSPSFEMMGVVTVLTALLVHGYPSADEGDN